MYYSLGEKSGRKFLFVVTKGMGVELSCDERNFVLQSLPVEGEWLEGVWDYEDSEMESILESMTEMEPDPKADKFRDCCIDDDLLDDE